MPSYLDNWDNWWNRWWGPGFFDRYLSTGASAPVDVCERDNAYVIRMACAGCRPEDIEATVENDTVRIRGKFFEHEMAGERGTTGSQTMGSQQMSGQPMSGQSTSGQQMSGQQMGGQSGSQWSGAQGNQSTGQQSGQRTGQQEPMGEVCLIRELPTGRFERDITLPTPVNSQQTQATFENGLLTLVLPKTEAAMGHRIQIGQGTGTAAR
jgi:HSP20 family molecular chaperone IbpA